jgi:multidrug efflux pump subunit AcrA (membrane-fusion protein)
MKKKVFNLITLVVSLAMFLSACGNQPTATPEAQDVVSPDQAVATGRVKPIYGANLYFRATGVVDKVLVKEGDAVKAGDVLVRLANADGAEAQVLTAQNAYDEFLRNESGDRAKYWQAYMDAQAARAKVEKKWDDLNLDNIDDTIDDRKATVAQREKDLKDAQEDFDRYKDLDKDNPTRKDYKDKLDQAQDNLNEAVRNLESETRKRDDVRADYDAALAAEAEAKHQYEISVDGPNPEKQAVVKASLDEAKDTLSNYEITAPFDGVVAEMSVKAGEQVTPETRAASVADFSQWIVETTDVTELKVVKLSPGQSVSLIPDAIPDLTINGTISEISQAYTQQGGDILYTVRIIIKNPDPRLRWGMTVEVTFE